MIKTAILVTLVLLASTIIFFVLHSKPSSYTLASKEICESYSKDQAWKAHVIWCKHIGQPDICTLPKEDQKQIDNFEVSNTKYCLNNLPIESTP